MCTDNGELEDYRFSFPEGFSSPCRECHFADIPNSLQLYTKIEENVYILITMCVYMCNKDFYVRKCKYDMHVCCNYKSICICILF